MTDPSKSGKAFKHLMKAANAIAQEKAETVREEADRARTEKKLRDTRLVHVGILIETMMKTDDTLLSRVEAAVRDVYAGKKHVLKAFRLDQGVSWFDEVRKARAEASASSTPATPAPKGTAEAGSSSGGVPAYSKRDIDRAVDSLTPEVPPRQSPAVSPNGTARAQPTPAGPANGRSVSA